MDSSLPSVHSWTSTGLYAVCGQRSNLCSTSRMYCRETFRQLRSQSGADGQTSTQDPGGDGAFPNQFGCETEELSVRQVGRKLRVSGKTEKKQEDEKGCYSYRRQEFRQEFDLPEGLNPEDITCYLAPDGKLHIQEAKALQAEEAERELTIERSLEEKTQQSVCSNTEDSSTDTDSNTQDKPEDKD
ncbi:Heat shock protein 30 [Nibea albiflora]|uniref:Heat shock protein 30 n=1 Tax=Nibea albiflora TaxID=240163 RepID=A0ACB7F9Y4_NIBAL|nr:Heat shock protein 30 [Nibea albiflora]